MVMGIYTFLQMIEVLNLVAFSLAIAAQMLEFCQSNSPCPSPFSDKVYSGTIEQVTSSTARL